LHLLLRLAQLLLDGRNLRLLPRHRVFQRLHLQLGQPLLGLGILPEHQHLLLEFGFGFAPRLLGRRLGLFLKPRRELFGLLAQTRQLVLAFLERRFALLPALFERLLAFLVLLLRQAHIFLVLVLRLLALERLLVFVLLDFALPLLLEAVFLLLALALHAGRFILPRRALRRCLSFQLLLLARVILHHLVQRRGRHVDLVQPLQFLLFQRHGLPRRRQKLHLAGQPFGDVRERLGNLQPQSRDLLHHAFHRDSVHGLPDLGFAQPRRLVSLGVGRLASGLRLLLNIRKLLPHFHLGAPATHRRLRRFHWHNLLSFPKW